MMRPQSYFDRFKFKPQVDPDNFKEIEVKRWNALIYRDIQKPGHNVIARWSTIIELFSKLDGYTKLCAEQNLPGNNFQ